MKSGKSMDYTNWAPGEPNNGNPGNLTEDCLHLYIEFAHAKPTHSVSCTDTGRFRS